ncbi:MAG: hypothetical protein WC755_07290 [Candidatus Woesearchaeota archaeon]
MITAITKDLNNPISYKVPRATSQAIPPIAAAIKPTPMKYDTIANIIAPASAANIAVPNPSFSPSNFAAIKIIIADMIRLIKNPSNISKYAILLPPSFTN